jgi:hypothetical protein
MLYPEFRRHLGKAGMTINEFAAYLCVQPASVSNYSKSGSVPRTYAIVAIFLGEAADRGADSARLLESFGVTPRAVPTGSNVKQFDMFRVSRAPAKSAEGSTNQSGVDMATSGISSAAQVHQPGRQL